MSLYGVKGVRFEGCTFRPPTLSSLTNNGITSLDASFIVDTHSATSTATRIEKFHYGIHARNVNVVNASTVNGVDFYLNDTGAIYMSKGNYSTITYNLFRVFYATSNGGSSIPKYGVYMHESEGYSIRKNTFLGSISTWTANVFSGVYINNGGISNNSVYNNYFKDLNYGLNAQEQNQDDNGGTGLIMNCNEFVNCKYNISVVGTNSLTTGVLKVQGSFTNSALYVRNRYAAPSCGSQNLYFIDPDQSYQLWHPSFTGTPYQPIPQHSCSDSTKIRVYQLSGTFSSMLCPDNCTGCRTAQEINESIKRNVAALERLGPQNTAERAAVQHEINFEKNQLGLLSNERIRQFLNDTSLRNPLDSVIAELKLGRNPSYKKQLFGVYLQKGELQKAIDIRDSVLAEEPGNADFSSISTELIAYNSNPVAYVSGLKNNPILKNKLLGLAANPLSEGNAQAQALLGMAFGIKFREHFVFPEPGTSRFGNEYESDEGFSVYPNPAQNLLTIGCRLAEGETAKVTLFDISGRIVKSVSLKGGSPAFTMDVSDVNDGIYFVSLHKPGSVIENKKLIIAR